MLSGETAKGAYPLLAVQMMAETCYLAEATICYPPLFNELRSLTQRPTATTETVAMAAVAAALEQNAGAILVMSTSGNSARLISKYRPSCPIITRECFDEVVDELTFLQSLEMRQLRARSICTVAAIPSTIRSSVQRPMTAGKLMSTIEFGMVSARRSIWGLCERAIRSLLCRDGSRAVTIRVSGSYEATSASEWAMRRERATGPVSWRILHFADYSSQTQCAFSQYRITMRSLFCERQSEWVSGGL